jgi:hypothetical protein
MVVASSPSRGRIYGRVYARHGTNTAARLTVIDRVPANDAAAFPASPGMASDTARCSIG